MAGRHWTLHSVGGHLVRYESWGRHPKARTRVTRMVWRHESLPLDGFEDATFLPFGNGRSYGDSCLNDGGVLIDARPLDRFILFDPEHGVLRCEAGVLLSEILDLIVPNGWLLRVLPGTRHVTVGGAIANDVHGKNHHRVGTFGRHVRRFELLRSDSTRLLCSPRENADWYRATIGGLGLTGLITWAEIELEQTPGPHLRREVIRYANLDEFFSLAAESDQRFEYTAAWVDCLAGGSRIGRGLFTRANHCDEPLPRSRARLQRARRLVPSIVFEPPVSLLNRWSLKAFNAVYYRKHATRREATVHYERFFFPLDSIRHWNRLYGPRGFVQYQCVIGGGQARDAVREILDRIARAGMGSFLAVLKVFGEQTPSGLLSFPRPGVTLALDFTNRGAKTFELLDSLDQVTRSCGGAVYPAKDARMSAESFRSYFPRWAELVPYVDPRFSSSFWRRVHGDRADGERG